MNQERRATFAKVLIGNGGDPKTVYSLRVERAHWIVGIVASLAAIAVALLVLRGAVYASVQDVAHDEFRTQLEVFHSDAQPAIRSLIEERIVAAQARHLIEEAATQHATALTHASELAEINASLARMDERLEAIERRLP